VAAAKFSAIAMSNEAKRRNSILFVDDDQSYLVTLANLFEVWSEDQWVVKTAGSVAEGLDILGETPMDLVVTDLQMPVADGLQFVQLIHKKYPRLPKVVLTSRRDETARDACLQAGADLFLNKPTDIRQMEDIFASLKGLMAGHTQAGFRGVMHVELPELIQLECLGTKSSVLQVSNAAMKGEIFIRDGRIIHAVFNRLKGVEALNRMLALTGGDFARVQFREPPVETISDSWEMLLMEAARLRDEAAEQEAAEQKTGAARELFSVSALPPVEEIVGPRTEELLISSDRGEVIYAWQSPDAEKRLAFFDTARDWTQRLNRKLPLGRWLAMEAGRDGTRVAVRVQEHWVALVRTNSKPAP
jgi:CheY-like chemotaxis protein